MVCDKAALKLISMSNDLWVRHANPWGVWTRIALFPFWFLTVWSWVWIGWRAVVPAAILAVWTWLNPVVFKPYTDCTPWRSRGVLGERIFINQKRVPAPRQHLITAHPLSDLAGFCLIGAMVGFVLAEFWEAGCWPSLSRFGLWTALVDPFFGKRDPCRPLLPAFEGHHDGYAAAN